MKDSSVLPFYTRQCFRSTFTRNSDFSLFRSQMMQHNFCIFYVWDARFLFSLISEISILKVFKWPFIWILTRSLLLLRPHLEKSVYLQTLKCSVLLSLYSIWPGASQRHKWLFNTQWISPSTFPFGGRKFDFYDHESNSVL